MDWKIGFMLLMMMAVPFAAAVDVPFATNKLSPDSKLYWLDKLFDDIKLNMVTDEEGRAMLHIEIAEERLQELLDMLELKDYDAAEIAEAAYGDHMDEVDRIHEQLQERQRERLQERLQKHADKMEEVQDRIGDNAARFQEKMEAVHEIKSKRAKA